MILSGKGIWKISKLWERGIGCKILRGVGMGVGVMNLIVNRAVARSRPGPTVQFRIRRMGKKEGNWI
jgi:hypothetical protein